MIPAPEPQTIDYHNKTNFKHALNRKVNSMGNNYLASSVPYILKAAILFILIPGVYSTCFAQNPEEETIMEAAFEEAIDHREKLDWDNYYSTLRSISNLPYSEERVQQFIDFTQQEAAHLKQDAPIQAAYVWNYVARMYVVNGYQEEAITYYEQAMEGLRPHEDTLYLPHVYFYLSQLVVGARSDGPKGLEYVSEARRLYEKRQEQDGHFIAELYYAEGRANRGRDEKLALQYFRKAQALSDDKNGNYESFATRSLLALSRFEEALISAEIVIEKQTQYYNEPSSEGYALAGQALSGLGRYEQAIDEIQKGIEAVRSEPSSTDNELIPFFYFLAQAQGNAGKYEEALSSCQMIFQQFIAGYAPQSNYDTPNLASFETLNIWVLDALKLKGRILKSIYKKTKRIEALKAAVATYSQSIHDIEKRRNLLFNWSSKELFNNYIFNAYDDALVCATLLYEEDPSLENRNNLFSFLEQSKATLLRENIEQVEQYKKLPPQAKEKRAQLQQQIADAETELLEQQRNKDSQNLEATQKKVFDLHTAWEQFLKKHAMAFDHLAHAETTLEEMQSMLDIHTAILAYHITAEEIIVVTIKHDDLSVERIKRNGDLVQSYKKMHEGLSNWEMILRAPQKSNSLFKQHADTLGKLLLKPVLDLSPVVNKLVILPDGLLHGVPFEALTLPGRDHFLLEDYNISYAYTLSTLDTKNEGQKNEIRSFGGYAPSYTLDENPIVGGGGEISADQFLTLRSGLIDIPEARANLIDFANRYDGLAWTEKAATKTHFMSNAKAYDLLHLGMHGQLDTNSSFLSHLVFYGEEENKLYLREIQAMDIPAELIVLSACNTGVGSHINGEGPLSLARAFFYAGAKSTLMSLWQVPDQQTAKVMRLFYDNIDKGFSKSKALTEAKRTFLKDASSLEKHPAFWSGFVLVGDPTPLHIRTGWSDAWLMLIALLSLLMLGYGYYRKKENKE